MSTTTAQAQVDLQQQAVPAGPMRDVGVVSADNLRFKVPQNICRFDSENGPEMVVIPPGSFRMGSDDNDKSGLPSERPARDVTIDYAFALGRCEVTYAEFQQFADEVSGNLSDTVADGCFTPNEGVLNAISDASWKVPQLPVDNLLIYPVVCVSIPMVEAYIGWLNEKAGLTDTLQAYRLPTEAELAYVMHGGGADSDGWRESDEVCNYANLADQSLAGWLSDTADITGVSGCDDGFPTISPVGTFVANPYGLHDLFGNVWEWTADCWHASYEGAPADGSAWLDDCTDDNARPLRGGSWGNLPENLRAAFRSRLNTVIAFNYVGFRLARTLP